MSLVAERMMIDVVDDHDNPIGAIARKDVFTAKANFRVVHIFLFNSRNELLVQQLAATRDRHPGQWGSSVAGYLNAGETYAQAAERRIPEELGVSPGDLRYQGKTQMRDEACLKFIGLFIATGEGPFPFDRDHIAALEFLPMPVIAELLRTGQRSFTPTFAQVFDFFRNCAPDCP